jgi:hypothetical protein
VVPLDRSIRTQTATYNEIITSKMAFSSDLLMRNYKKLLILTQIQYNSASIVQDEL